MKTIKINTRIIKSFKPCQDRLDNWLSHYKSFNGPISKFLNLKNITHRDKLWIFLRLLPKEHLGPIAADFAEEVVNIYERYNADSSVLKTAIAAARGNDIAAARNAGNGAYVSADAAAHAAYAASIAAFDADAAAYAAYAASIAAVWAADDKDAMEKKQIEIMNKWSEKIEMGKK
jgi:hypothetical protein